MSVLCVYGMWLNKYVRNVTSQVLNKVIQLHLPVWFDAWAVHVCIEEYDSKGQDEYSVRILELPHQCRVTHTVTLTEREKGKGRNKQRFLNTLYTTKY